MNKLNKTEYNILYLAHKRYKNNRKIEKFI